MSPVMRAASFGVNGVSGKTVLAVAPVLLLLAGFLIYCLIDLVRVPRVRYLPKAAWALIIVVGNAPIGALAYLIWGRDRRETEDLGASADRAGRSKLSGG